jgi:hypothetical protein
MTALADMEELLAAISNKDMVDYMREAQTCYGAGAYRGCIVMSYLALFDDLRLKLEQLAKVNATAKTIWDEVEKRSGNQEVFESYMADQLQKTGLLTKAEHKQLELVRDIRNRAAHPSGVHAKAEEARYVYRTVIDDFLSRQLLKSTHAADAVLDRLAKGNLFPGNDFDDVVEITKAELASVNPAAQPYLIAKLVAARGDATLEKNAGRMLAAIAATDDALLRSLIGKKLLEDQSHDPDYGRWIRRVIAADGAILKGPKADAVLRVRALLTADAGTPPTRVVTRLSHPATQLASIIAGLGEDAVLKDYEPFAVAVLAAYPYAEPILDELGDAPKLRDRLVEIWLANARSSTFETANAFASAAPQLDDYAEALLTGEQAFQLVIGVVEAAEWNARKSKALRAEQFSSTPKIREMALRQAQKKPTSSGKLLETALPGMALRDFLKDELAAA